MVLIHPAKYFSLRNKLQNYIAVKWTSWFNTYKLTSFPDRFSSIEKNNQNFLQIFIAPTASSLVFIYFKYHLAALV